MTYYNSDYSFSRASSTTRIWLDELGCSGSESRLSNCPANPIGSENCIHSEDIALDCTESTASKSYSIIIISIIIVCCFLGPNGDLRLVDNSGRTGGSSGRLEVYFSGQWGTVCQDNFGINNARVACRQLGFSTYTRYGTVGRLG